LQRARPAPSPHPHPLADAVTLSCELAKASLPGEGWGEGAFAVTNGNIGVIKYRDWSHCIKQPRYPGRTRFWRVQGGVEGDAKPQRPAKMDA
jgi:hypothetical protein